MPKKKKRTSYAIKKVQVQELLQRPDTTIDAELTERYASDVYNLSDGKVLAVFDNGRGRGLGKIYESRASFISMLEALEKQWAGKPGEGTFIPARKVQKLLAEQEWTPATELNKQFRYTYYQNADGKFLVIPGYPGQRIPNQGAGILYDSKEQYLDLLKPRHVLYKLLPQGKNFINEVPKLIDDLAVKLSISPEKLDGSEASLGKVEWAVKRLGKRNCLEPEIFPGLLAYIGEVNRQLTEAEWEMRLSNDGETWEPWLLTSRGRYYEFFIELYKQLYDEPLRLRALVWTRLER